MSNRTNEQYNLKVLVDGAQQAKQELQDSIKGGFGGAKEVVAAVSSEIKKLDEAIQKLTRDLAALNTAAKGKSHSAVATLPAGIDPSLAGLFPGVPLQHTPTHKKQSTIPLTTTIEDINNVVNSINRPRTASGLPFVPNATHQWGANYAPTPYEEGIPNNRTVRYDPNNFIDQHSQHNVGNRSNPSVVSSMHQALLDQVNRNSNAQAKQVLNSPQYRSIINAITASDTDGSIPLAGYGFNKFQEYRKNLSHLQGVKATSVFPGQTDEAKQFRGIFSNILTTANEHVNLIAPQFAGQQKRQIMSQLAGLPDPASVTAATDKWLEEYRKQVKRIQHEIKKNKEFLNEDQIFDLNQTLTGNLLGARQANKDFKYNAQTQGALDTVRNATSRTPSTFLRRIFGTPDALDPEAQKDFISARRLLDSRGVDLSAHGINARNVSILSGNRLAGTYGGVAERGGFGGRLAAVGAGLATGLRIPFEGFGYVGATFGITQGLRAMGANFAEYEGQTGLLAGSINTFNRFKKEDGSYTSGGENYTASKKYAQEMYSLLRKRAIESPTTTKGLFDTYVTGYPFLGAKGLTPTQSVDIADTVASLGKMSGLRTESIRDDLRALSSGNYRNVQTFQMAGVTPGDFKQMTQLRGDDFYKTFKQKFAGFEAALDDFGNTLEAKATAFQDALYQFSVKLGKAMAPELKKTLTAITDTINKWENDGTLDRLGNIVNKLITISGKAAELLVNNFGKVITAFEILLASKAISGTSRFFGSALAGAGVINPGATFGARLASGLAGDIGAAGFRGNTFASNALAGLGIRGQQAIGTGISSVGIGALGATTSGAIGAGLTTLGAGLAAGYGVWDVGTSIATGAPTSIATQLRGFLGGTLGINAYKYFADDEERALFQKQVDRENGVGQLNEVKKLNALTILEDYRKNPNKVVDDWKIPGKIWDYTNGVTSDKELRDAVDTDSMGRMELTKYIQHNIPRSKRLDSASAELNSGSYIELAERVKKLGIGLPSDPGRTLDVFKSRVTPSTDDLDMTGLSSGLTIAQANKAKELLSSQIEMFGRAMTKNFLHSADLFEELSNQLSRESSPAGANIAGQKITAYNVIKLPDSVQSLRMPLEDRTNSSLKELEIDKKSNDISELLGYQMQSKNYEGAAKTIDRLHASRYSKYLNEVERVGRDTTLERAQKGLPNGWRSITTRASGSQETGIVGDTQLQDVAYERNVNNFINELSKNKTPLLIGKPEYLVEQLMEKNYLPSSYTDTPDRSLIGTIGGAFNGKGTKGVKGNKDGPIAPFKVDGSKKLEGKGYAIENLGDDVSHTANTSKDYMLKMLYEVGKHVVNYNKDIALSDTKLPSGTPKRGTLDSDTQSRINRIAVDTFHNFIETKVDPSKALSQTLTLMKSKIQSDITKDNTVNTLEQFLEEKMPREKWQGFTNNNAKRPEMNVEKRLTLPIDIANQKTTLDNQDALSASSAIERMARVNAKWYDDSKLTTKQKLAISLGMSREDVETNRLKSSNILAYQSQLGLGGLNIARAQSLSSLQYDTQISELRNAYLVSPEMEGHVNEMMAKDPKTMQGYLASFALGTHEKYIDNLKNDRYNLERSRPDSKLSMSISAARQAQQLAKAQAANPFLMEQKMRPYEMAAMQTGLVLGDTSLTYEEQVAAMEANTSASTALMYHSAYAKNYKPGATVLETSLRAGFDSQLGIAKAKGDLSVQLKNMRYGRDLTNTNVLAGLQIGQYGLSDTNLAIQRNTQSSGMLGQLLNAPKQFNFDTMSKSGLFDTKTVAELQGLQKGGDLTALANRIVELTNALAKNSRVLELNNQAVLARDGLSTSVMTSMASNPLGESLSFNSMRQNTVRSITNSVNLMGDTELQNQAKRLGLPYATDADSISTLKNAIIRDRLKNDPSNLLDPTIARKEMYKDALGNGIGAGIQGYASSKNLGAFISGIAGATPQINLLGSYLGSNISQNNYLKMIGADPTNVSPEQNQQYIKYKREQQGSLYSGIANFASPLLNNAIFGSRPNYSSEGASLGGMAAGMGAFASLGAFAGPVGILAGTLLGGLFGKSSGPSPEQIATQQHQRKLEELLSGVNKKLQPQEDVYRMIKGDLIWGAASRLIGNRAGLGLGRQGMLGAF